jgi:peptidoglycan LD-endopeptidase LytH
MREIVPQAYVPTGAHDAYRHGLSQAGLDKTALGRDWAKAAEFALRSATQIEAPFTETFHVDSEQAFALGYRFAVTRGQRTEVKLEIEPPSDWRIFLDLFRAPEGGDEVPEPVATGGEGDLRLAFEPRQDGIYLLRVQSELLRGGNCTLTIRNVASLEFPVAGVGTSAIRSQFGVPRDGGRRTHHGVDIFAARGTEVLATSRARVRRVDDRLLGGRVIWLEDPERDLYLYFAHLDTQDVVEGAWVAPGDRIGTVGNTGNARTTPPHLHFGIYPRGERPIDPFPFLSQPPQTTDTEAFEIAP